MKPIITLGTIFTIFLFTSCGTTTDTVSTNQNLSVSDETLSVSPERRVDLYGKIISIEGNEISLQQVDTSKDPTFTMTPEEKKKYMTSLDEATRMALREQINSAILGQVKVIVPVGIPMIKKTTQGPDTPNVEASLADLKNGQYISVWLSPEVENRKIAEFVKIAFTQ